MIQKMLQLLLRKQAKAGEIRLVFGSGWLCIGSSQLCIARMISVLLFNIF